MDSTTLCMLLYMYAYVSSVYEYDIILYLFGMCKGESFENTINIGV